METKGNLNQLCLCGQTVWVLNRLVESDCFQLRDCSPPDSSVHVIFQARILESVAISSSRGISPTQGSNLHLLHWQVNTLPLETLW